VDCTMSLPRPNKRKRQVQSILYLWDYKTIPIEGRSRDGPMNEVAIARALHVLAVVLWIGGVAFVTTVVLPAVRHLRAADERMALFNAIERRFAWQARITTLLAGVTGLDMLIRLDLWDRFESVSYWWMHAMVIVWLLFTVMLFLAEPLILHRWFGARAKAEPEATFTLVERLHRLLLTLSLITVLGAVAGSHGFLLFE
jgi:uncharacterized membrane protein